MKNYTLCIIKNNCEQKHIKRAISLMVEIHRMLHFYNKGCMKFLQLNLKFDKFLISTWNFIIAKLGQILTQVELKNRSIKTSENISRNFWCMKNLDLKTN